MQNWKVRKEGWEDAAKAFAATPDESDPVFRPFVLDSGLWKGAVTDSNVAAQQEGLNALCTFLKFGGPQACSRFADNRGTDKEMSLRLTKGIGLETLRSRQ